jgi:competence protein ComEC
VWTGGTDVVEGDEREVPDLRLVAPAVATWVCAGGLLGARSATALATGALLAALAAVVAVALRRPSAEQWAAPVLAVLVCAAAAAFATGGRLAALEDDPVTAIAAREDHAGLRVVVTGDPRPRADPHRPGPPRFVLDARAVRVDHRGRRADTRVPVVLLASGAAWQRMLPGHEADITGKLLPAGRGDLVGALVAVSGAPDRVRPPPAHQRWAGDVRARLRAAASGLPAPADGLVPAMVVGDTSALAPATIEEFRATGMTHLLTVSGTNLAVLTALALALGRWARWPPWAVAAGGAALITVFVLVARPEPSVLRAAGMAAVALLALTLGRRRVGLSALAATVIALLLFAPDLARSFGFALSVLATGGIIALAPGWRDRWSTRLPRWLAESAAVALAAHAACAPVLVLLSAEVSWVSIPANAVAGPLAPVVTVGGFAVAGAALVWPAGAALAAWVPGAAALGVGAVASAGAAVPGGAVEWRGDVVGALGLALLVVAALVLRGRARRAAAAVVAAVVVTAVAVRCAAPAWPPPGWAVVACDVGQGDALVLAAADGGAVVVDTGPDPAAVDRCLSDLGVGGVALLVVTHGDTDHAGGTPGLSGRRVAAVLTPPGIGSHPALGEVRAAGAAVRTAAAGQRWTAPPWTFDVLWPRAGARYTGNDTSVVLLARWAPPPDAGAAPMSVLLTGDIEEAPQRSLLAAGAIRGVDVLKTPHHGARGQEPAFLAATRARVTLTSVGAENPYGHPAPETWAALEALTPANHRTDLHGDIAVVPSSDGPSVVRRGPTGR